MNATLKKILWVAIPSGVMIGLFYWWYSKNKTPQTTLVTPSQPGSTPPKTVSPSVGNPNFPLQNGSRNALVNQLQTALGVTSDGIFGPQTLAALQSQFGISAVPDQNTLTAIINSAGNNGVATRNLALNLYNQFVAGGVDIYCQNAYFADEVNESSSGTLTPTGQGFQMTPGQQFDNTVYTIDGVTTYLGQLIIKVSSGPLQGEYTVDPSAVQLYPHNAATSVTPTTDPNTGLTTF